MHDIMENVRVIHVSIYTHFCATSHIQAIHSIRNQYVDKNLLMTLILDIIFAKYASIRTCGGISLSFLQRDMMCFIIVLL